jgi:protein SPT2
MVGISNLLASITGEKPVPPPKPSPGLSRPPPSLKRKADDDLRGDGVKRRSPNPATLLSTTKPVATPSRPPSTSKPPEKPASSQNASKPTPHKTSGTVQRPVSVASSKPNGAPVREAAPKKGSFKEIMARAERAREMFGQVGKIQHKKIERGATKSDRADVPVEVRARGKPMTGKMTGSNKDVKDALRDLREPMRKNPQYPHLPPSRVGNASRPAKVSRSAGTVKRAGGKMADRGQTAKQEDEQAQKKRRTAPSTGYEGTARPKPSSQLSKARGAAPTGGILLNVNPKLTRLASSRRSRYEDDEDDMSDFIDDDEEVAEDDGLSLRYDGYDSEGSSDMEAGLDEIDGEEEASTFQAKRDDAYEAAMEKRLKEEKERRKRGALGGSRYRG